MMPFSCCAACMHFLLRTIDNAAPTSPTTGVVGIVASGVHMTHCRTAHGLFGDSLVEDSVQLIRCVGVAASWTCIHAKRSE
jgi:hypothetical protein